MTEVVNEIQNKNLTFRNSFHNIKILKHITQLYDSRLRLQGRQHRNSGDPMI
jgi:division protein CdvB (Snf7/Vps24/ESCRT-III family)